MPFKGLSSFPFLFLFLISNAFSILFYNKYVLSTKNILQFFSVFFLYFSSLNRETRSNVPVHQDHNWVRVNTASLKLLPMSHTVCCWPFKDFDAHLGLLSQVSVLHSIQLLGWTKGVQG